MRKFLIVICIPIIIFSLMGFVHHHMVGLVGPTGGSGGGGSWSNTYSCKYGGTATSTAGRTNWGQPAAWCTNPSANAYSFSFWFKRRSDDGALLTSADQTTNSHFRSAISGTSLASIYAGGNFVSSSCSTSITNNTWTLVTFAFTGTGTLNVYVGNSSTACITFVYVGTETCTRDFIFNTLRSTSNSDTAFAEWGLHNLDEFTVWNTELTGTDHTARIDGSGHAVDPSTHSKAANLIDYYPCGDSASDSSTNLQDVVGSSNGTHSGSDGVTYPADVP